MSEEKKNDANVKLSWRERIAYGTGDYAGNLIYSSISAFLLVYYTNVVGVSAAAAASIIGFSKILDGISDLIMGYIIDHTHTRIGKARPWIARLCIPLAVCTVLMFTVPSGFAGSVQIAYMFLTYNLVSTIFYTGINVPYAAMNGLMTANQYERGLLGNLRNLFATAGTMTVNTIVLKMTAFFGDGDKYSQKGWTITVVFLMIAFVIINMFMFFNCKERVIDTAGDDEAEKEPKIPFMQQLKGMFRNKYWLMMVGIKFDMFFMMSFFFGTGVYYAQYILGNADYYTPISNCLSMAQIATLCITPFLMKKMTKRNLFLTGMSIAAIGFGLTGIVHGVTMISVLSVVKGIGFGFSGATMYGMLQDAITYGEWQEGYNNAGMGNAASSFCMKVGSGIGTAALGWVLQIGGFDKDAAIQSSSALTAIESSFAWIPMAAMIIAVVCGILFDLDKKYDKVIADLGEGKYKETSERF